MELEKQLEELRKELNEKDADPEGVSSLREEIEDMKLNADASKADLEDALKQNKMLQEEVGELKVLNDAMKTWVSTLEEATNDQKKEIDSYKRKVEEWQRKSGEWSDKAHQWKTKSEAWEKRAKSLDPLGGTDAASVDSGDDQVDPQALFLSAAVEKKKAATGDGTQKSSWGFFKKVPKGEEELKSRIEELEVENTKQSVEINRLKSEMVQMQSQFKEQSYNKDIQMEDLRKEIEAAETKSANLLKELELARKLNSMASNHYDSD
jgi:chromosome segregation ATPase